MKSVGSRKHSIADGGEQQSFLPVVPSEYMRSDEPPPQFEERGPLAAHSDARQLVRLVQCPVCSKPFASPVTLPCGHTTCHSCLPDPRPRTNISYPNTLDRHLGIACPACAREHAVAECSVDVTFTKLMDLIREETANFTDAVKDSPTLLEEVLQADDDWSMVEKEKPSGMGRSGTFHGGRLASTFEMAKRGLLLSSSGVIYSPQSPAADQHAELDMALLERLQGVAHKELECLVCYNTMLKPTTTACGHTFCRRCLTRVMDHSNICPICRRHLHIPASLQNQPSNARLVELLDTLCPDLIAARESALNKEEQPGGDGLDTPLFICTLALPTMPTFLHVFEPRYRLMMRRCIEGNRRFGMVMYNRGSISQGDLGATRFLEYGTLLEIVNYQMLRDGRMFVETRGVSRFRVREYGMLDGYDIGRIERVEDISLHDEGRLEQAERTSAQEQAEAFNSQNPPPQVSLTPANFPDLLSTDELFTRCTDFVGAMRSRSAPWLSSRIVSVYGNCPTDHAVFPYWFAAVLPIAEEEKYLLLKTTSVRERLKIVHSWIKRIEGQRWPSGSACNIL